MGSLFKHDFEIVEGKRKEGCTGDSDVFNEALRLHLSQLRDGVKKYPIPISPNLTRLFLRKPIFLLFNSQGRGMVSSRSCEHRFHNELHIMQVHDIEI